MNDLKNPYIDIIDTDQGCIVCSLCGTNFETGKLLYPEDKLIGIGINVYTYYKKIICETCFVKCNNKCEICNEEVVEDKKFLFHLATHFLDLLRKIKENQGKSRKTKKFEFYY